MVALELSLAARNLTLGIRERRLAKPARSVLDLANHTAWVPCGEHAVRNVARHHAAGSDDRARSDTYSGEDDRAAADPHVSADVNRLTEFFAAPLFGVQGMHWRVDLHRRAKQCVVTDAHVAHIQNHAIEIEEHTLAQLDVDAVVAKERRLHPHGVSTCAKQLTEDATPFLLLCLSGRIQRLAKITGARSPRDELGIERVVQLAGQHFLAFGHLGLVSHITSLSKLLFGIILGVLAFWRFTQTTLNIAPTTAARR